jgi:uncharacterized membrane protein
MIPQEPTTASRALKTWQRVRNINGVLVILAGIATAVNGIVALRNDSDTSNAMKLPITLALVCVLGFVHAQNKILALRKPNQSAKPTPPKGG